VYRIYLQVRYKDYITWISRHVPTFFRCFTARLCTEVIKSRVTLIKRNALEKCETTFDSDSTQTILQAYRSVSQQPEHTSNDLRTAYGALHTRRVSHDTLYPTTFSMILVSRHILHNQLTTSCRNLNTDICGRVIEFEKVKISSREKRWRHSRSGKWIGQRGAPRPKAIAAEARRKRPRLAGTEKTRPAGREGVAGAETGLGPGPERGVVNSRPLANVATRLQGHGHKLKNFCSEQCVAIRCRKVSVETERWLVQRIDTQNSWKRWIGCNWTNMVAYWSYRNFVKKVFCNRDPHWL